MAEIRTEKVNEAIRLMLGAVEEKGFEDAEIEDAAWRIHRAIYNALHPATTKDKVLKWLPPICSTLAVIISAISILATVWK